MRTGNQTGESTVETHRAPECMSAVEVTERVITAHDQHVCRKPEKHQEPHRCWACTRTWKI